MVEARASDLVLEQPVARVLRIGAVSPHDQQQVERGFSRLSAESRHLRYGLPLFDPGRTLDLVASTGEGRHFALGACTRSDGEPVGVARYVRAGGCGEVAVTVVDAWQGQGVGSLLLDELLRHARARGIRCLRASVIADNRRAIRLARRFGARLVPGETRGMFEYELPLAPDS